jgi:hypothetical protein
MSRETWLFAAITVAAACSDTVDPDSNRPIDSTGSIGAKITTVGADLPAQFAVAVDNWAQASGWGE